VFLSKEPSGLSLTADLRAELRQIIGSMGEAYTHYSEGTQHEFMVEPIGEGDECFRVLGISPNASIEEARAAYRKIMKECHPDLVAGLGEELRALAEEKTKEINRAYEQVRSTIQARTQGEAMNF
jgi:DnaJ-domain-containing protein 1